MHAFLFLSSLHSGHQVEQLSAVTAWLIMDLSEELMINTDNRLWSGPHLVLL